MIKLLIIALIFVASAQTECNVCQSSNNVACHAKNQFSLCIDGAPSRNFISCRKDYVCTAGRRICYPQSEAVPSCDSMCNVCNDKKVYACKNETTIAFCYGNDRPDEEADVAHCIENTVCDIYRSNGFCTEIGLAEPSCVTASGTNFPNTTIEPASPTEELTSEGSAITEPTHSASENSTTIWETTATTTTNQTTAATTITTTSGTSAATTTTTRKPTTTPTTTTTTTTTPPTTTVTTTPPPPPPTTTTTTTTTTTPPPPTTTTKTTTTTSEATVEITTETAAAITTTTIEQVIPPVPLDPDTVCRDADRVGFYSSGDPTCKSYVICYHNGHSIAGIKQFCQKGQYFPPGATYCSSNKPDVCT